MRCRCWKHHCWPSRSRHRQPASRLDRWCRSHGHSAIRDRSNVPRANRPPGPKRSPCRRLPNHCRPDRCRSAMRPRRSGRRCVRSVRCQSQPRRGLCPCHRVRRRRFPVRQVGRPVARRPSRAKIRRPASDHLRRRRIRHQATCRNRRLLRRRSRRRLRRDHSLPKESQPPGPLPPPRPPPSRAGPRSRHASWRETSAGCDCARAAGRA